MKRYIRPVLETYAVNAQSMIAESIGIEPGGDPIVGPVSAKGSNDFEFGDDEDD